MNRASAHVTDRERERGRARIETQDGMLHRSNLPPTRVGYLGEVFSVRGDVLLVLGQLALKLLDCIISNSLESLHAVDGIDGQVKAVHVVAHDHVKRGGGGAFFFISAHMKVVVVLAAVIQAVNQPRVSVIRKGDGVVGGKKGSGYNI